MLLAAFAVALLTASSEGGKHLVDLPRSSSSSEVHLLQLAALIETSMPQKALRAMADALGCEAVVAKKNAYLSSLGMLHSIGIILACL